MRHADPNQLQSAISKAIGGSGLAAKFKSLTIGAEEYDDRSDFIRVLVHLSDFDKINDDDVDALISSIESVVSEYDDRFPSVRFSEN